MTWANQSALLDKGSDVPLSLITLGQSSGAGVEGVESFDNTQPGWALRFRRWLEDQGFFVGHRSHSNYAWTHLSLASTFNGEYVQTLVPDESMTNLPGEWRDRRRVIMRFHLHQDVHRLFAVLVLA